jgi:hypothetical protein
MRLETCRTSTRLDKKGLGDSSKLLAISVSVHVPMRRYNRAHDLRRQHLFAALRAILETLGDARLVTREAASSLITGAKSDARLAARIQALRALAAAMRKL